MKQKINQLSVYERIQRKYEQLYTQIFDSSELGAVWVANEISNLIKEKQKKNEICVLGLATGSSPIGVYRELVRMYKEEGLSFKNVVTFNLDEYYPMEPDRIQSYVYFMHEHLFDHIDIDPSNINIPDGTLPFDKIYEFCQNYEQKIKSYGGIDLQLLGIGRTGHVGFNEPGSGIDSPTRLISLDTVTIADAAGDFRSIENVPRQAITMGIGTIMQAKKIILLAWGEKKASIIKKAVESEVTDSVPATFLQKHNDVTVVLDKPAAEKLTRIETPWLVGNCEWNQRLIRKAVVWLSNKLSKPVLKLRNRDYNDNHLGELLANYGPAYNLNINIFNQIQHCITGWPGGKPNADDSHRPERAKPYPKRVLVFSPHPDDDVISMGGTLLRLVEQGHIVHIAYQTSGNISVPDDDVLRFVDFAENLDNFILKQKNKSIVDLKNEIFNFFRNKRQGDIDIEIVRNIKTLIREGEARAACRFVGISEKNIDFLRMPFYETGTIKKSPITERDIELIVSKMRDVKPHQIYAAGDLTDPHGTHRRCLEAVYEALKIVKNDHWAKDCYVWLYRGAWQEWDIAEIDMAVPLNPDELDKKRKAIFKHRTQKDIYFPGTENKEVWRHSIDRNKKTAELLNALGMAEYEAIELFAKYDFLDK
jgi:glucosamine-6-phosphate deaminase